MRKIIAGAVFASVVAGAGLYAIAQDALVRTPLQKSEFPGDTHVSHIVLITVAPGATIARHTHPGIEMGYVLEGEAIQTIEGKPDLTLKAGDSYAIPAGAVHGGKNIGDKPLKVVVTLVVDKSKPLTTPAP